jgi:hypothetical protein
LHHLAAGVDVHLVMQENRMTSRRHFLWATGATLLVPGGTTLMIAQRRDTGDPILDHINRELVRLAKQASRGGEHGRAVAANLRLLHAHAGPAWAAADQALRRALKAKGRAGVVADGPTQAQADALAAQLGLPAPTLRTNYEARAKAIALLERAGFKGALREVAAGLERVAAAADHGPIVPAQVNQQESVIYACRELEWRFYVLEAMAFAASVTPGAQTAAVSLFAAMLALQMWMSYYGC